MNILLIYDSKFGNTEKVAQTIALALSDYGTVRLLPVEKADAFSLVNASDIHLLIVGCPTQIHGVSPAMRQFLDRIPPESLRGMPALCFDTRYRSPRWITGSAARRTAKFLDDKGAHIVFPPESFFVMETEGPLEVGELNRAAKWAQNIIAKLAVPVD